MERTDGKVKWGILGTANIAVKKVVPAMMGASLSRVEAIASRSPEKAEAAADELAVPRSCGSYEELLSAPDIEAVYIPLPNHLHLEWALAAARAGKHVLCEKPLALTSADARLMVDTCSAQGVKLMEGYMYRLHPMWVEVQRLIATEAIGEVMAVETTFAYRNLDPANIRNVAEFGGGALYDIGCYAVNVSRLLFGSEPTAVKAMIRRDERFGTDVLTSAILDFGGGHAVFRCSTQTEHDQRVAIQGTKGRLVVEIPFNIPPDHPTRILRVQGGNPPEAPAIEVHEVPPADQYRVQADAFSRAILEDAPVPIPPEDAVANLAVIEAIFADAAGDHGR